MVLISSSMVDLGSIAPDFELINPATGSLQKLKDLKSNKATIIMFICNHCPYVKHIQEKLAEVGNKYSQKGFSFIAINSNDVENYPEDKPEKMIALSEELGFNFPYLFDERQEVAKAYQAQCTPDFFVYSSELKLIYRGQFDDSRPGNKTPVTGADLIKVLDLVLDGKAIEFEQKASIGCNIKWKK